MNNPEYAKIGNKKYKINTDFKIALECNEIAEDDTISDYERALAIIYKLYGDEGLNNKQDWQKLLEIASKFLRCGMEETKSNNKQDMDFIQDYKFIQASFKSDYGIELSNMHWYDFYMYLNGLTDKCILSRIRELRTFDLTQIKDPKEKQKIIDLQKQFELKKKPKQKHFTQTEQENIKRFYEQLGIKKGV